MSAGVFDDGGADWSPVQLPKLLRVQRSVVRCKCVSADVFEDRDAGVGGGRGLVVGGRCG